MKQLEPRTFNTDSKKPKKIIQKECQHCGAMGILPVKIENDTGGHYIEPKICPKCLGLKYFVSVRDVD